MSANAPHPEAWENALAAFENDLYRRGRSEKTMVTYGSCLQNFARFYRRELQKPGPYIARLEENDFEAFIDHIQYDRRLSASDHQRSRNRPAAGAVRPGLGGDGGLGRR